MKFLINGMDFNVFNSLPKEDAEFLAQLESYDRYPLWDYEEFSLESVEFDELYEEIGIEGPVYDTMKDVGSLGKNTLKLVGSTAKTGAAVAAGGVKAVNYGIKGINTGIRWIQAAVKWLCNFIKKSFNSTREWLKGSMGPMLNNLWQSFSKFSQRWDVLDNEARHAIGVLNTMGVLQNPVSFGYHRQYDVNALAAFYHIVENVESYINAYIWTYFNFKYTNLQDLVGQDAQGTVMDNVPGNNNNNNQNTNKYAPVQNESIDFDDIDFGIATEDTDVPTQEKELVGIMNRQLFNGQSTWIRPSEIAEFSKALGEYFKDGNNGQGVNRNMLEEFKTRLDSFAACAKISSTFGDLTFAYCIFGTREMQNFLKVDEGHRQGFFQRWFSNARALNAAAKGKEFKKEVPDIGNRRIDYRAMPNMGIVGAGAYIKTAICGFNEGGNAYISEFRQGNQDIQAFKDVCQNWLSQTSNVVGACRNMSTLLKGNAKPITRFTTMLLDGLPEIVNDLNNMANQIGSGSVHTGNMNTTGMADNPQNNNNNGNFNGSSGNMGSGSTGDINMTHQGPSMTNGSASVEEDDLDFINSLIATEAGPIDFLVRQGSKVSTAARGMLNRGVGNATGDATGSKLTGRKMSVNNPHYANQNANNQQEGLNGTHQVNAQAQAEQAQKLKDLQTLFRDISAGVSAYQTTIQGICSTYATYVRGFMGAAFEYIIDTENMIKAIYRASGNEVNKQLTQVQQDGNLNNNGGNGNVNTASSGTAPSGRGGVNNTPYKNMNEFKQFLNNGQDDVL